MRKRKPLSPEAKAAAIARLHDVMRKFCERMERRKAERNGAFFVARRILDPINPAYGDNADLKLLATEFILTRSPIDEDAEQLRRIADAMGANI